MARGGLGTHMNAKALPLLGAVVALTLLAPAARAQEPLDDARGPFNVDATITPVLGPTRIVGMGGAFTAVAHGSTGAAYHPASFAVRPLWERRQFEWDGTASFSLPTERTLEDFFNSNSRNAFDLAVFVDGGLGIKIYNFGLGFLSQALFFRDGTIVQTEPMMPPQTVEIDLLMWTTHIGVAYGLFKDSVVLGAGVRLSLFRIGDFRGTRALGVGPEIGLAVGADDSPFRAALGVRLPVRADVPSSEIQGARDEQNVFLPQRFYLPWEMNLGFSLQFGERPPQWSWSADDMRRENAARFARRRYVLLAFDMFITGPVPNAIGVDAFIDQEDRVSGEDATLSLRVGVEGEPWRRRMKLRAGSYIEPTRNATGRYRVHGTFGADYRLFTWDLFGLVRDFDVQLSTAVDFGTSYLNWSVTVGFWH